LQNDVEFPYFVIGSHLGQQHKPHKYIYIYNLKLYLQVQKHWSIEYVYNNLLLITRQEGDLTTQFFKKILKKMLKPKP
jgi:hypothetical protein